MYQINFLKNTEKCNPRSIGFEGDKMWDIAIQPKKNQFVAKIPDYCRRRKYDMYELCTKY